MLFPWPDLGWITSRLHADAPSHAASGDRRLRGARVPRPREDPTSVEGGRHAPAP